MSRVLVVDDESVVRESWARLLTAAGHAAVTAGNGRDAWLTMYEGVPGLILLDLMMPQMDGITFLRLLRHSDHWADVPVIVVTGFTDDRELVEQAKTLGVVAVVPKADLSVDQLLRLVERTLAESDPPPVPHRSAESRGCRSLVVSGA